jgi:hypothetical protein
MLAALSRSQKTRQPMSSNLNATSFSPPRISAAKRGSEITMLQRTQVSRSHLIGCHARGQSPLAAGRERPRASVAPPS